LHYIVGEKPKEEGQTNDDLEAGSIVGIIIACVTALVILIFIIALVAVYYERKKRMRKVNLKATNANVLDR